MYLEATKRDALNAVCAVGVLSPLQHSEHFQNTGCGTFISENEVVTCWHVFMQKDGTQIPRQFISVKNQEGRISRVSRIVVDKKQDLAYLKLATPIGNHELPIEKSRARGELTDTFQMLSYFREKPAVDNSLIKTIFNRSMKINALEGNFFGDYDVYLTTNNIQRGYSGSAITRNGALHSVLSAKSLRYQGEIFAVEHYHFVRFLEKARKEPEAPQTWASKLSKAIKSVIPIP